MSTAVSVMHHLLKLTLLHMGRNCVASCNLFVEVLGGAAASASVDGDPRSKLSLETFDVFDAYEPSFHLFMSL